MSSIKRKMSLAMHPSSTSLCNAQTPTPNMNFKINSVVMVPTSSVSHPSRKEVNSVKPRVSILRTAIRFIEPYFSFGINYDENINLYPVVYNNTCQT